VTENVLLDKKYTNTTTTKQIIEHLNPCHSRALNPGHLAHTADALPLRHPPSQLRVTIEVKLFNCFDAMGRNVNKQSRICGPHIFNKSSLTTNSFVL